GEPAALFVHRAADFHRPRQLHPGTAHPFDREQRRGDSRLHVTRPAPVDPSVLDGSAERIAGPAVTRGHHVEVAVEVDHRPRPLSRPGADDVDAGMTGGVLGTAFGSEVLDLETTLR